MPRPESLKLMSPNNQVHQHLRLSYNQENVHMCELKLKQHYRIFSYVHISFSLFPFTCKCILLSVVSWYMVSELRQCQFHHIGTKAMTSSIVLIESL